MMEDTEQSGAPRDSIRLLLVDDEKAYVNVLYNRLTRRGFQVTRAFSGAEALRSLRGKDFDVAVLDLKMTDMDGIEVLKIARLIAPDMQVIMLTGHGSATACKEGLEQGAFDYLTKPCELDTLIRKIQAAFAKRQEPAGK